MKTDAFILSFIFYRIRGGTDKSRLDNVFFNEQRETCFMGGS